MEVRSQRTTTWRTSTMSLRRTSTDSSLIGTSSGRATCTTILRLLRIRKLLFKRVAQRSLRGGRIVGLCAHFQALDFVNKAKVNEGNRKKKTILHHSDSMPFSYRMDARRRGGSKFPKIDVFGDVYVRPGNELAESLHTTMVEMSQLVLQESASQLPPETPIESVDPPEDAGFQILTETLDQTLGRRPGTYCRGMGNARQREPRPRPAVQSSQVTALTAQVATLQSQMSVILESLARSGIPIPQFHTSTSEPVHPEHPQ
ncbi:unnamed protein product [Prunus armeniaca]